MCASMATPNTMPTEGTSTRTWGDIHSTDAVAAYEISGAVYKKVQLLECDQLTGESRTLGGRVLT